MNQSSRRRFVTAGALALSVPGVGTAASTKAPTAYPHDVGRKFRPDGTVLPFGGNTFIGHIRQQGPDFDLFNGLLDIYREFPTYDFASKVSLTPPSSYHVTVFGGLNEEDMGKPRWPSKLPPDMPINRVTQLWLRQLQARPPLAIPGFEFEFGTPTIKRGGAPHIPLRPVDDATATRLAALRNELSALTGIRDADHDRYEYHMTFGYTHAFLSDSEAAALKSVTQHWIGKLSARGQRIRIPAVQFCRLVDMYAFQVLHEL